MGTIWTISLIFSIVLSTSFVCGLKIEDVERRLDEMENREKTYLNTISTLMHTQHLQDQRIEKLETQVAEKVEAIKTLESAMQGQYELIKELKRRSPHTVEKENQTGNTEELAEIHDDARMTENQTDTTVVHSRIYNRRNRLNDDIAREQTLHAGVSNIKRASVDPESPIAFHAVLEGEETSNIGVGQHIPFPTVLLNLGGGYHKLQTTFICPLTGIYVFSTSIMSYHDPHPRVQASIMKNGHVLAQVYGHGGNGHHNQGSVTVTTQLQEGDEVWVELHYPPDDSIYGGRFTSFTGFLLSPV